MNEEKPKLQVGDKLWFVPRSDRGRSEGREITVIKIGRLYADIEPQYLGRMRLCDLTVMSDEWVKGQAHRDRAAYETVARLDGKWKQIRRTADHFNHRPSHLSEQQLDQILAMLEGVAKP